MAQDPNALLMKADRLVASSKGGLNIFGGRTTKLENAAELYTQAANSFRMLPTRSGASKAEQEADALAAAMQAGRAFETAAEIQTRDLKEPDDAANTLTEAYKVYKQYDTDQAAKCLNVAITHYASKGNFRRAAGHEEKLGDMYLAVDDQHNALACYEQAASWYESDDAHALASKLNLLVAEIAAKTEDWAKAWSLWEDVAKQALDKPLMKFSIPKHLLHAGLCHFAYGDTVGNNHALAKYREMDPTIVTRREYQLLDDLREAIERGDQDQYSDKLYQYDKMSPFDNLETTILLKIKQGIEAKDLVEDFV